MAQPHRRFSYRLAERLGGMTRDEMMARMSAREFAEWYVMDNVEFWEKRFKDEGKSQAQKAQEQRNALFQGGNVKMVKADGS